MEKIKEIIREIKEENLVIDRDFNVRIGKEGTIILLLARVSHIVRASLIG